ncbi:MAG: UvrD-helicase domain-containing protein [Vicinamibacteria bacterium]
MKPPADQSVRDRVVTDFDTTFLLEAGAGTGKTTVLIGRIVALIKSGRATIDRLAAITFTDPAAGELKLRLRDELEAAAAKQDGKDTKQAREEHERLKAAAASLDRAMVSTIHSFALAILKERPFEAGLDPEFRVAADVRGQRSFDEAWADWIDARLTTGDPAFLDAFHLGTSLDDLREAARSVVAERDVLGKKGPEGTQQDPHKLRARLTESARRLSQLESHCIDENDGAFANIQATKGAADRARRAEGAALRSLLLSMKITWNKGAQKGWNDKEALKAVKDELKALRDEKEAFEIAAQQQVALNLRNRLADFLDFFTERQRRDALVDFQGLLLEARNVLANDTAVRRYFQARFDALLIDEFQDTDPLQVEIAFFLAEDPETEPASSWTEATPKPGKLFLVGDPKQSIYRFRRADLGIYQRAKDCIQKTGGEVLRLTSNFRTVPSILSFVNARFDRIFRTDEANDPEPTHLRPERSEVAPDGARVISLPVPRELIDKEEKPDSVDTVRPLLAAAIAGFVHEITETRPWSVRDGDRIRPARPGDIGLLVRNLTGVEHLETALRARKIGYRLVGGKAYHQRGEVAALRAVLTAIDNAAHRLALVQALRSPFFGLSDHDLAAFVARGGTLNFNAPLPEKTQDGPVAQALEILKKLHRARRIEPPSAVVRALFEATRALPGFLLGKDGIQAVANVWKIAELAQSYEAAGPATLRGFVRFLEDQQKDAREEGDSPVGDEAGQNVEILTVHKAKGLEYPIVVLADILATTKVKDKTFIDHGTGEGWLKIGRLEPPGFADQKAVERTKAEAEERRLLYVALTRARDHLILPTLPLDHDKTWKSSWALPALIAVLAPDPKDVTLHDTTSYFPPPSADPTPRPADALEGTDPELKQARESQDQWTATRTRRREQAKEKDREAGATAVTEAAKQKQEAPDPKAAAFGKLVHAILAKTDLDGKGTSQLASALAQDYDLDQETANKASSLVLTTLKQPIFDRIRGAKRVLRETPITASLDGERVVGQIDLAFQEADSWTVIEYKTGQAGQKPSAQAQLLLYGRALQAATSAKVTVQQVVVE